MSPRTTARRSSLPLGAVFLAAGGLAMTVQVLLLRELLTALQGDEISISLGLSAWLAGIAAGAFAARRTARPSPEALAGFSLALLAVAGPAGMAVLRLLPGLLAPPAGELFGVGSSILMAAVVLAPAGALVGTAFTSLASAAGRAGWEAGRAITRLYILEAAGALAAGLLLTWAVIPILPPLQGAAVASIGWLLLAWPAAAYGPLRGRYVLPTLAAVLAVLAAPPVSGVVERITVEARHRSFAPGIELLHWEETPYTHVAVGGGEVRHLYEGGRYVASFPDRAGYEPEAHTVATLAPAPRKVLLFGNSSAGLVRPLLLHPVESVELVAIDRRALEAIRRTADPGDALSLDDPRVRIVHDDPRRYLRRGGGRYGLIVVREPEPATLLSARLTTVEFYRACAGVLEEDGVLVVGVRTGPNVVRGESARLAASIYRALREVFPVVRAGPGPDGLLVAGFDPGAATLDPGVLAGRYAGRAVRSERFAPELFPVLFPPDRVAYQEKALADQAESAPAGRDERPVSFLHAMALRQRIDGAFPAPLLGRAARVPPIYLCVFAVLPSLAVLLRARYARDPDRGIRIAASHAVAVTGACGIGWSLLLLFSYQTRDGALYGRIGLLVALFMCGLALGAAALSGSAAASAGRSGRRLQAAACLALIFAAAIAGVFHLAGRWLGSAPLAAHAVLMAASGFVTGALFPAATGVLLAAGTGLREAAGRLESADHAGAAWAALAAGVLFVPALGLTAGALLLVVLEGLALQGVVIAFRRRGVRSQG